MIIVRYADDRVPRTHRRKEVRNCVRDGGRSSGAGRQGQASNHRKLRRLKAGVVGDVTRMVVRNNNTPLILWHLARLSTDLASGADLLARLIPTKHVSAGVRWI